MARRCEYGSIAVIGATDLGILLLVQLLSIPQLVCAFAGNGSVVTGYRSGTETTSELSGLAVPDSAE